MTTKHSDLDLTSAEDRAIFRTRVSEEFEHMTLLALVRVAAACGQSAVVNRHNSIRAIADHRIGCILTGATPRG